MYMSYETGGELNIHANGTLSFTVIVGNCQAPSQIPKPSPNPVKISSKGTGADTKILWATTHPTPPTHNF